MRKARPLRPPSVETLPTPLEPDSGTVLALTLYRYSRWPDLKADYHCRFECDPERLREPMDARVFHGED